MATAITVIEGDDQFLSVVMKVFHDLQKSFDEELPKSPVLRSEEPFLKEVVSKRREWLVQKIHLAANLLDPRFRGCHISDEEAVDAIELVYEVALRVPSIDANKVLGEIAEYSIGQRKNYSVNLSFGRVLTSIVPSHGGTVCAVTYSFQKWQLEF